jgi:dihydroorotase
VADVSVLDDLPGAWRLRDNEGNEVVARRMFSPAFCLRRGRRVDATAPILPLAEAA